MDKLILLCWIGWRRKLIRRGEINELLICFCATVSKSAAVSRQANRASIKAEELPSRVN